MNDGSKREAECFGWSSAKSINHERWERKEAVHRERHLKDEEGKLVYVVVLVLNICLCSVFIFYPTK